MKNPDYVYYCNDCATKKGYPKTQMTETTECDICGITCFANAKHSSALTIYAINEDMTKDSFFNTTGEKGEQLKESNRKASGQNNIILEYYRSNRQTAIAPSEVWKNCFDVDNVPITSIRRGISVLTKKGKLIKTAIQVKGLFGKDEYQWRLKK